MKIHTQFEKQVFNVSSIIIYGWICINLQENMIVIPSNFNKLLISHFIDENKGQVVFYNLDSLKT